ncbi:transposase, partial [Streptomyces canus]|uniref:transposase n=1 Tax=Streptomyces canus TaxID=58343 RepID=UPI0033B04B33
MPRLHHSHFAPNWCGFLVDRVPAFRAFRLDQTVVGPGVPLTDAQWARIEPLLPDRTPKRGGRWRDHREVIDAIAFKFQTGT